MVINFSVSCIFATLFFSWKKRESLSLKGKNSDFKNKGEPSAHVALI